MITIAKARGLAGVVAALMTAWAAPAVAARLSISCGAVGAELQVCREGVEAWARATGHEVQIVSTPNSATERLALYQQILAARSGDIDVFQIDVIWPGILGSHFVDLKPLVPADEIARHFPAIVENNTVGGRLVALPWFTDAGLLYYRRDLLEKHGHRPPATWQELATVAADVQAKERAAGNARMWGYVFQGKAYEGLTCNALEWVDSFGGGVIVAADGSITIDNPRAAAALGWAATTIGTIAPEGVLNYAEEEARGVFQSGNAVFMRNWPYAWALAQAPDSAIRDKVGVAALPKGGAGGKPTGALGGWELAVSQYSRNRELAVELVRYLTSQEEQKRRAIAGSFNPTIPALYRDPEILAASPFMGELFETFVNAVARPSRVTGNRYNQVSAEFFGAVHQTLSGQAKPDAAVKEVAQRLDRLSRGGRW
jgi:trehalose/maltose transport system substrate-binding protein